MLKVTNGAGRVFNVRPVFKGDRYGLDDCKVHDKAEPMIEFYDATYQDKPGFGERGQFVSRYYISTLETTTGGLMLDGGIPEWVVSYTNVREAVAFTRGQWSARA